MTTDELKWKPAGSATEEVKRWADQGGLCSTAEVAQITGFSKHYISELCAGGKLSAVKGKARGARWRVQRWSVYLFCKDEMVQSGA